MTREKVQEAFLRTVGILADEKGKIKQRLFVAYASHLSSIRPQDDLPKQLSNDFREIRYTLSDEGMPYGYGEHAAKKLQDMTEEEASEVAREIFSIFLRLTGIEQSVTA